MKEFLEMHNTIIHCGTTLIFLFNIFSFGLQLFFLLLMHNLNFFFLTKQFKKTFYIILPSDIFSNKYSERHNFFIKTFEFHNQ